ncbi:MAG TPA: DUF3105 domain-containing protein [Candidatus Dormibacteraeota bacterium]|jgi:hypothetical protein|nr:DUF3105 domain-containing protein [Candidatus Dormibacteraeota bacterium]
MRGFGAGGRLAICAVVVAASALSACGSGSSSDNVVDNSTCPYGPNSAGPYSPNPPKTNGKTDHAQVIPEMPHEHVSPPNKVTYAHNPPTSGCHYSLGYGQAPIAAGAYPYTATIPAEYWVHNLEHGYMAVLYNCPKGCDADFEEIRAWLKKQAPDPALVSLAKSQQGFVPYTKVIVVPWPSMTAKFAAVSWDYYDPMDKVDTTELQAFFDNHLDTAPEGLNTP